VTDDRVVIGFAETKGEIDGGVAEVIGAAVQDAKKSTPAVRTVE
jgi:hypothetical protein